MRLATVQVAVCLSLAPAVLKGQLYLLSGTPGYALDLVAIGDSGVKSTTEILPPPPQVGGWWVAVSYDTHEAVALAGMEGARVLVFDLNQTAVVKQCAVPGLPNDPLEGGLTNQWLARLPGGELTLELLFARRTGKDLRAEELSVSLDLDAACDRSFNAVPPDESLRYLVANGMVGVGGHISAEGSPALIDPNGDLAYGNPRITFGFRIPADLLSGLPKGAFGKIDTNTPKMMIAAVVDNTTRVGTRFLLFRKSDQSWHEIPVRSDQFGVRAFGAFAAVVENVAKPPEPHIGTAAAAERTLTRLSDPVSAGRSEWRTEAARTGPSIAESFDDAGAIYPGRLHVYNIDTEKLFTITTNQGDSEILLIEDNTVYYRVSDRLYKAPITDSGIGAATLIATDDAIRDAHWAFIKH